MIRYALKCDQDHDFEAWFSRSDDFDSQVEAGQIECPWCASRHVRKAIMAPAVAGTKRDAGPAAPSPDLRSVMMQAAQQVRAHVEQNFDYVGDRFAREARDIHDGVSQARGIYGEATPKEVEALRQDGVPVAPMPPAAAPKPKTQIN